MPDRHFLHLSEDWALGYDDLQWIVYRAYFKRGAARYEPKSFIGSTKRILRRVLRENGIEPTSKAKEYLDTMPDSFTEWRQWWLTANQRKPEPNLPEFWVAIEAAE